MLLRFEGSIYDILLPNFIPGRGFALPDFPGLFKKSSFKMADSQNKNSNESIFFRRNIDQYSVGESGEPRLSKERMQYFFHALKLDLKSRHSASASNCSMNRSARTKGDYKFSTAKDPLFNSTRIC